MSRVVAESDLKEDPLTYWRVSILFMILFATLIFCPIAIVAAVVAVMESKAYAVAIFDVFAYGICFGLFFPRQWLNYKIRASIILLLCYFVGVIILVFVGPAASGPIWLFMFAILAGVLLGKNAAMGAVFINGITLVLIALLASEGRFGYVSPFPFSLKAIISACISFMALNLVASMSITVLVKGLISTIQKEKDLATSLELGHRDLLEVKNRLELEAKERKQAVEELREREEKYRLLADNINDIIWIMDIHRQCFIYVSPSVKKMRGFSPEEALRQSLHDILPPESYKRAVARLTDELAGDKDMDPDRFINLELEQYRKDGSTLSTEITASFIRNSENRPVTVLGVTRDISERKEAEKALWEKEEKLVRLKKMESLGLMAGGIAHDLNNILSGIVSYPDLLLMDLPESSPLRYPLETIKESGLRAAAVVSDLVTVARGVATRKEVINLNKIIAEYLGSAEHKKLQESRSFIVFKTELDTDLLKINGSPIHLKKILMNLVINASEAIEDKGVVAISTSNLYLDEPMKGYEDMAIGEYVLLNISDNGVGISQEHIQRIFEPFYTKKIMGRSGTGLGLAVVWNTVQDHDGYINIRSNEQGTEFEIMIPATRKKMEIEKRHVHQQDYRGNGELVLVVDDEKNQRIIACELLKRLGYMTEAVSSGEEAVEYLKTHSVDLILLDMIMPKGINGRETYEQMIKIYPEQKAIIVSGFAETEDVKETRKSGAGKYLKKPYTMEELGIAVRGELDKHKAHDFRK